MIGLIENIEINVAIKLLQPFNRGDSESFYPHRINDE